MRAADLPGVSGQTGREPRIYSAAADGELMTWAAAGDERAFDEVVVRYGSFALRLAARLVGNATVAEDIVQEAMVRAWSQASRFDPGRAALTTWLYRIVVNLCIDHSRKRVVEPLPDGFDLADPATGAHEALETSQRAKAVERALMELPASHRAAVSFVYQEGLSGAETARIMGLSAKAVERLLSRALASLRARLLSKDGQ